MHGTRVFLHGWGRATKNGAVTNPSEVRVEADWRGWLYVEQLIMTGVYLLIGANTLGSMLSTMSLAGLPLVSTTRTSISKSSVQGRDSTSRAEQNIPAITANVWSRLGSHSSSEVLPLNGVYVGAGSSPVPNKVAERIRRWEFVDMAELLPEVRLSRGENEGRLLQRKPRCVTDIITWIQCFGAYVSVLGPAYPAAIPELMAYMTLIVCCSQDYANLAWVRYDMAFRRQAAIAGNRKWSEVNGTLYVTCFTGKGLDRQRCELYLSSSHRTGDCLLQGGETAAFQQPTQHQWEGWVPPPRGTPSQAPAWRQLPPSGKICKLWNENRCRYARCRHTHACM